MGILFQTFIATMPNDWDQVHLYEKHLKADLLRRLEKHPKKDNSDKEMDHGIGTKMMNLQDEKKIHALKKGIERFKNLLFSFHN